MRRLTALFMSMLLCFNMLVPSFAFTGYADELALETADVEQAYAEEYTEYSEGNADAYAVSEDYDEGSADNYEESADDHEGSADYYEESAGDYGDSAGYYGESADDHGESAGYGEGSEDHYENYEKTADDGEGSFDPSQESAETTEDSEVISDGISGEDGMSEEMPAAPDTFIVEEHIRMGDRTDDDPAYMGEQVIDASPEEEIMDEGMLMVYDTDEEMVTVTLKDCLNSSVREDYETEEGNLLDYVFVIPAGRSLMDHWAVSEEGEPSSMADFPARRLSEIVWNAEDGTVFDLNTPITEDTTLSSGIFFLSLYDLAGTDGNVSTEETAVTIPVRVGDKIRDLLNQTFRDEESGEELNCYVSAYDGAVFGECCWFDGEGNPAEELFEKTVKEDFTDTELYAGDVVLTAKAPDGITLGEWHVRYGSNLNSCLADPVTLDALSEGWVLEGTETAYTLDPEFTLTEDTAIIPKDEDISSLYRIYVDGVLAGYILPGQAMPEEYRSQLIGPWIVNGEETEEIRIWLDENELTGDLWLENTVSASLFVLGNAPTHTVTFIFPSGDSRQVQLEEGKTLTKEQLYDADNKDYRFYKWMNGTEQENLSTLTVTEDITLTGSFIATNNGYGGTVKFYVLLNDRWTQVGNAGKLHGPTRIFDAAKDRYFVTDEELEAAFGPFGFSCSTYNGEPLFPHTDAGTANIWRTPPMNVNGLWLIKTVGHTGNADVFYVPGNTATSGSVAKTDASLKPSGFYSLTWYDPETREAHVSYVRRGGDLTVDLPDGYEWTLKDLAGNVIGEKEAMDEIRLTEVTKGYVLQPDVFYIKYMLGNPVSPLYGPGINDMPAMSVEGQALPMYMGIRNLGSGIEVKAPDHESISITKGDALGNPVTVYYDFKGWMIGSGSDTCYLNDGDIITKEVYDHYVNAAAGELQLKGVWTSKDKNNNFFNVNYYVCIEGTIHDTVEGVTGRNKTKFTGCVYTTRILGAEDLNQTLTGTGFAVLTSATNLTAYEVNDRIRQLDTVPAVATSPNNQNTAVISLQNTPSDSYIMGKLKKWQEDHINDATNAKKITIDGAVVPVDRLTTTYFTVRWYVFKYDATDCWHIDGIIVPKKGMMRIIKSFHGDADAIAKAKANFSIRMGTSAEDSEDDILLTLNDTEDLTVSDDQMTYTWIKSVLPCVNYYIREQNYEVTQLDDGTPIESRSLYSVYEMDEQISGGYQNYTGGNVEVESRVYATDASPGTYETVSFTNTYLPRGSLMLKKEDSYSGGAMKDVKFRLEAQPTGGGASTFRLWQAPGTSRYSATQSAVYSRSVNLAGSYLTTDENGALYIYNVPSDMAFTLTETTPEGYDPIDPIKIVTGTNTDNQMEYTLDQHENAALNGSVLNVNNTPKKTELYVSKSWGTTPQEQIQSEVAVRIYKRTDPAAEFEATSKVLTLSSGTNWEGIVTNLPLYENGKQIEYSIREYRIGPSATGTLWSASVPNDGYEDWEVTVSDPVYKANGSDISGVKVNSTYADRIEFGITNELFVHEFNLSKTDENGNPVVGAVFKIYGSDGTLNFRMLSDGSHEYVTADHSQDPGVSTRLVTGNSGILTIRGLNLSNGYRFEVQESTVPTGYDTRKAWPVSITLNESGIKTAQIVGSVPSGYDYAGITSDNNLYINNQSVVDIEVQKDLINPQEDETDFDFELTADALTNGYEYSYSLTDEDGNTSAGIVAVADGKISFRLKADEKILFRSLPVDEYTVKECNIESPYFFSSSTAVVTPRNGTAGAEKKGTATVKQNLTKGDTWTVCFHNGKNPDPDVGIRLDSLPFIVILVIAVSGGIFILGSTVLRVRRKEDDE